jgi:predicted TIM-barrel fold metal-dependent hydrolase
VLAIAKLAGDLGVPFVFHYNFDYGTSFEAGMAEVEDALRKNPNTTYVLAHNPVPPLLAKYPNLWAEVSMFVPQFVQVLQQVVIATPAALDRIVLCIGDIQSPNLMVGAGIPQPITYKQAVDLARSGLAPLTPAQRDGIAYKNLMRLLKLS